MEPMVYRISVAATRLLAVVFFLGAPLAMGSDQKASEFFHAGLKAFERGDYVGAAKRFLDAEHMATTVSMRADAVKEAVKSYREAGLLYREFEAIEKLLVSYPSHVDYESKVARQYEIGDAYFRGHRDPAFWALRWIPWLTAPDKTVEIYQKALAHAPFAAGASQARLRLAVIFIEDGKPSEALTLLRDVIEQQPDSPEAKFAYLELGNALFELSRRGDGDGRFNSEAVQVFREFIEKYPDAPERDWVEKCLLKAHDIQAARLHEIAAFYHRIGRNAPAERYLGEVMRYYPDSTSAERSEALLTQIDNTYTPEGFRPELKSRYQRYDVLPIPSEPSPIIIVPESSDGRWLIPIRDLGMDAKSNKE